MPIGRFAAATAERGCSRGASAYPHLDSDCHLVEGELLRRFLSILADDVEPEERLVLGRYVSAHESLAVANGTGSSSVIWRSWGPPVPARAGRWR